MDAVYITDRDDVSYNAQIINEKVQGDKVFVLIEYGYNDKDIIQGLIENTTYRAAEVVYQRYATLYLLER